MVTITLSPTRAVPLDSSPTLPYSHDKVTDSIIITDHTGTTSPTATTSVSLKTSPTSTIRSDKSVSRTRSQRVIDPSPKSPPQPLFARPRNFYPPRFKRPVLPIPHCFVGRYEARHCPTRHFIRKIIKRDHHRRPRSRPK